MKWEDRVGRRIKLHDLHILLAVAQTGSMAKAADRLSISHPVISKTISELERILGVRLFDRRVRGVELTLYGRALVKSGAAVFDEMRQGIRQIEYLTDPTAGELRLACPESIAAGFVQAVAERFMHQNPKVVLHVVQTDTVASKYRELREDAVELLIGRLPKPVVGDDLIVDTLFDEPMLVVAGAGNPWTRRRNVDLGDLLEENWVLPPVDSVPGMLGVELFRAEGLSFPRAKMVTLSIHLQNALLAGGHYLTLYPGSLLHFGGKRLGLKKVPVNLQRQRSATGIITLRNRTLSPLTQRFVDCVRAVAAPLKAI